MNFVSIHLRKTMKNIYNLFDEKICFLNGRQGAFISRGYFGWLKCLECLNVGTVPTYKMHNIGKVPTFLMHIVGTVPMFKMRNVGTPKSPCLKLEFGLYGKDKWLHVASEFSLQSSRTLFQDKPSTIQSQSLVTQLSCNMLILFQF